MAAGGDHADFEASKRKLFCVNSCGWRVHALQGRQGLDVRGQRPCHAGHGDGQGPITGGEGGGQAYSKNAPGSCTQWVQKATWMARMRGAVVAPEPHPRTRTEGRAAGTEAVAASR